MRLSALAISDGGWERVKNNMASWCSDVSKILGNGIRIGDQFGQIVTFDFVDTAPPTVSVRATSKPLSLWCLSASPHTSPGRQESGSPLVWEWVSGGQVKIHGAPTLSPGITYTLTVLVLEG